MKCPETNIQLLLDNEIDLSKKQKIEAHLAVCNSCLTEFRSQAVTKKLLKQQPAILPSNAFDNSVLQAFEDYQTAEKKHNAGWFTALFAIPKPILVVGVMTFLLAAGFAFQIGRLSVSSPPHIDLAKTTNETIKTKQTTPDKTKKQDAISEEPEIRTVTKYVKVPIVREKVVEKIIFINKPVQKTKRTKKIKKQTKQPIPVKNIAAQFNLRDMRSPEFLKYEIIKQGANE